MYDKDMLLNILHQTLTATKRVSERFKPVDSPEYFTNSEQGLEKLDAICMLVIAIGESIKNFDKVSGNKILSQYSEIDWKGVKGIRDIISHHYFDVDAEEIYFICKNKIKPLEKTLEKIILDLKTG
jgi:uncharacterized protein with HEPN domain